MTFEAAFEKLSRSKFRSRFKLSAADRAYIAEKGLDTIRRHAEDFVRQKLAPQREAVRHFIAEGRVSGNMYPTGRKICSWYAGTMSAAASYMGDREEPARWLREAASVSGLFGEYFEINEPGSVYHPWFGTAAGNCLYAINQMLLCDRAEAIYLGTTVPMDWQDYSFTLPSLQGVMVSMSVEKGVLSHLEVVPRAGVSGTVCLVLPEGLMKGSSIRLPDSAVRRSDGGFVTIDWTL